jgi:hypothetical protein
VNVARWDRLLYFACTLPWDGTEDRRDLPGAKLSLPILMDM